MYIGLRRGLRLYLTCHIKGAVQKGVGRFFKKDQTSNLPNSPQFLATLLGPASQTSVLTKPRNLPMLLNAAKVTQLQIGVLYTFLVINLI